MTKFNKVEFGERLRKIRKDRGLSQENLATAINKNASTVARYETGKLVPDAEDIFLMCRELEISEGQLFNDTKIINTKDSINPFNTKTLYIYYNGYYPIQKKYDKCKFKINILPKENYCAVEFVNYKTDKIYMSGHIETDNFMVFLKFNNYKPNSPRLECTQINVNISGGINRLMKGALFCTNGIYEPSTRKCFVSPVDIEFTDEMLDELKITESEYERMKETNIYYPDIRNAEDF